MQEIGTKFETEMINALNNKFYKDLSANLKNIIFNMFPNVDDLSEIKAKHCEPYGKPDIKITINNDIHYLSLKTGTAKAIHCEAFTKFLDKVKNIGVSERTISILKQFQYGDGTEDGTGEKRYSYEELFPKMISDIKFANEELNYSNEKMVEFVDILVFKGNYPEYPSADFIYHGNIEYGVIVSRTKVLKHLRRKNYDYMRNLHIGPIQFHPYARYVDFEANYPEKREKTNFKWINFEADLYYISTHYNYN